MTIQEDLHKFYENDVWTVIEDAEKFRRKLDIGADAFQWLSKADHVGELVTSIASGTGVAGVAYWTWLSSLGFIGKLGLTFGFLSTPVGWLALAGAGSAVVIFLTGRVVRSFRKKAIIEIPNFINTPLDLLGSSVAELLCPILLKIAHADDFFCDAERMKIESYFTEEWGFSNSYIKRLFDDLKPQIDSWEWSGLGDILKSIEKTGDLKFEAMSAEIIRIANEVMATDGKIHPKENEEMLRLKQALKSKGTFSTIKHWLNPNMSSDN